MHLEGHNVKCLHLQVMSITETQVSAHTACVALGAVRYMSMRSVVQHVSVIRARFSFKQWSRHMHCKPCFTSGKRLLHGPTGVVMRDVGVQYNGVSVIIISPDSDNLSVLQAALLGLDLRSHAQLGMRPGEVRAVELASASPALYSGKVTCARPPNCL